jgi:serine/threonine-protein kinase HipA
LPAPPKDKPAPKQRLSPLLVRKFSENLGLTEKPLQTVITQTVLSAVKAWPKMIEDSRLTTKQKENLLGYFNSQPLVTSARARLERRAAA